MLILNKISNIFPEAKKPTVTLIGSGFSGLSAGAYLAKDGCQVNVYEKNNEVGGLIKAAWIGAKRKDILSVQNPYKSHLTANNLIYTNANIIS